MKTYRVVWEINLEAEDAEHACRKALEIQRDPESIAMVFTASTSDEEPQEIDLY